MYIFRNETAQNIILSYHMADDTAYLTSYSETDDSSLTLPAGCEVPRTVHFDFENSVESAIRPIGSY